MIPKVIHYCWFGRGEMSPLMKKCVKSWKKFCPDYEIKVWNEDTFDINSNIFVKQAYECKKWAFVSDYVRLHALYNYGGIYLDTDVELRKNFDDLLHHSAFGGFEFPTTLQTGVLGCEKGHPVFKLWFDYYNNREYLIDGKPDMNPNVKYMTELLVEHGLILNNEYQEIMDMAIYPKTYFCPLDACNVKNCITKDTYCLHYFTSSWRSEKARKEIARNRRHTTWWYRTYEWLKYLPKRLIRKIFGDDFIDRLKEKLKH